MGLQIFQLERNGKLEGDTCANPVGPCHEWAKDPKHCKVVELDHLGSIVRYLSADECRETAGLVRAYN
jgi:hypothetical protein